MLRYQSVWKRCGYGSSPDDIAGNTEFLKHLFGGPVGEVEQKAERNLPDALEDFDPFSASAKEVLKHKRRGGHKSQKTHAGKRGVGSYKREDMAWLKMIVKESSEDPRPAYLKRVQKMVDLLSEEVTSYRTNRLFV